MCIQRFSNLEFDKWDPLRSAIYQLIDDGTYRRLVRIHFGNRHRMHGSMSGPVGHQRFLPWHRAYLINFERELRNIDASLSIPYWDWEVDDGELRGFFGLLGLSSGRNLGTKPAEPPQHGRMPWFTTEAEIEGLLSFSGGYYRFSRALEFGPHNNGHAWIGGDMGNPMISPRDAAFWFHHAQVDRIWALWQQDHPNEIANLSEQDAQLDPWHDEFDVHSVNNINDLGDDSYEYVEPSSTIT